MTDYISAGIVTIVVLVGLFLFYRALREPLDHLFRIIGWLSSGLRDKVSEGSSGASRAIGRTISYD